VVYDLPMSQILVNDEGRIFVRCDECETLIDTKIINTGSIKVKNMEVSCPVCYRDVRIAFEVR
jgi:hypothetical protein